MLIFEVSLSLAEPLSLTEPLVDTFDETRALISRKYVVVQYRNNLNLTQNYEFISSHSSVFVLE